MDQLMPQIVEKTPEQIEENTQSELDLFPPDVQRAVHLHLSGSYRIKEIAGFINRTPETVRKWLRNPVIIDYITKIQKEEDELVKQGLNALRMKALYKMNDLIDSEDDNVALNAVKEVLNRTGHSAIQKKEVSITHKTFEEKLSDLDGSIEAEYEVIDD